MSRLTPQIATVIGAALLGLARRGSRSVPEQSRPQSTSDGLPMYRYWGSYDMAVQGYDHHGLGLHDPQDISEWDEWEWREDEEKREFAAKFGIDSNLIGRVRIMGRWPSFRDIVQWLESGLGENGIAGARYALETLVGESGYFEVAAEDECFKAWWVENHLDDAGKLAILRQAGELDEADVRERAEWYEQDLDEARAEMESEKLDELESMVRSRSIKPDLDPGWEELLEYYGIEAMLGVHSEEGEARVIEAYQERVQSAQPFTFDLHSVFPSMGRDELEGILMWFLDDRGYGEFRQVTDWYTEPVSKTQGAAKPGGPSVRRR